MALEARRAELVSWLREDVPIRRMLELAREDPQAPYTGAPPPSTASCRKRHSSSSGQLDRGEPSCRVQIVLPALVDDPTIPAWAASSSGRTRHFWDIIRARPYMHVRLSLAQCLGDLGRRDEAIAHYCALIRLDPDDHQGVRDMLLAALLLSGRDAEAAALLEQFGDEPSALWHYGRALRIFRREGDGHAARAALRVNRHVPRFLTDEAEWPDSLPAAYAPGSREEAVVCDGELGEAWRTTPEAIRWLRVQAPARRSGKRRR